VELSTLKSAVSKIAEKIGRLESRRRKTSAALRSIRDLKFRIGSLTDDKIINEVDKVKPTCSVAGVDGGLLMRSFHGIDVVVTRAVGVVFNYKSGKATGTRVFPQKIPFVSEVNSTNEGELITVASLHRMKYEVLRAVEVVEKAAPDYIMMDGPLYPHPSTRVAKGSHLKKLYLEVVSLYNKLAAVCEERGTKLVGIVEDSRSRYFASLLFEKIVPHLPERSEFSGVQGFRDTALLYDALKLGERTCTFKISGIQDLQYKNKVFAFYIRPAKYDRPLRVEFFSEEPGKDVSPLASLVYGIASFSQYGLPSVLVEADLRAKLKKHYMHYVQRMLFSKLRSPLVMSLRRENRPF
jgi:hypothetical protein